jgi:hypothetical protein
VEKYAQLITLTPTLQPLLSPLELAHAQKSVDLRSLLPYGTRRDAALSPRPSRFQALVAAHMKASVLDSLPERLGDLEEVSNDGMSMSQCSRRATSCRTLPSLTPLPTAAVAKPDLEQAVFVYCREDVGPRRLPSCVSESTRLASRPTADLVARLCLFPQWRRGRLREGHDASRPVGHGRAVGRAGPG